MQVILDSSFARPGSAPIWGGKKGEFRDWTSVTRVLSYWLDALTTKLWETGDEQGDMLGSYMCDTCPAILVGRSNH